MTQKILALALVLTLFSSCTSAVFNAPMTLSTRVEAVPRGKALQKVSVERCSHVVLLFISIPYDPREVYDDLLTQARKLGGDSVINFELRHTSTLFTWVYNNSCIEATGVAYASASRKLAP